MAALERGDADAAAALAEQLARAGKHDLLVSLVLGVRAIKNGHFAEAREHLRRVRGTRVADAMSALLIAWALQGAGNTNEAIASLDKLKAPAWFAVFRDLHAGLILDVAGRTRDAGLRYQRAHKTNPSAFRVVQAYGAWLARTSSRAEAMAVLQDYDRRFPGHPLIESAIALIADGHTLNRLADSVAQGSAEVLYGLGIGVASSDGGYHLAVANLRLAVDLAPQHDHALLWLGSVFRQRKMPQAALTVYERIPADSPLRRLAEIQAALSLVDLNATEARQRLEQLVSENPRDLNGITALGNLLRSQKQYAKCAEVYGRGIATLDKPVPANWTIFYFRGICLERQNRWDQAERDLEQARALNPDNPQLLNYLGYSLIDRGLRIDEALQMIRQAVKQRPNDGYIADSLGWAYFKLGRFDEALVQLTHAGKLLPNDPKIADHIGDVLWVLGRQGEARAAWKRALTLSPEPQLAKQIEGKLKSGLQ